MTATPPRADLRTLAAVVAKDRAKRWGYTETLGPVELANYVHRQAHDDNLLADLAAALPEHRRMVLGEAVDDLHRVATHLRAANPDSSVAKGVRYAEARIRAQLAAAPPAGLSAPVSAGTVPAVPEEAEAIASLVEFYEGAVVQLAADRDRLAAQVERVRAIHTEFDGRCAECVNYCDCIDRVTELGDDVEVAAAMRMCEHGNKPWPCPTIAAVDALPDVGTDQTEDDRG